MSDTTASLRRKIISAGDLQSVVRTMKALAAASIGQYEKSVRALGDYYRAVELGLSVCFRGTGSAALMTGETRPTHAAAIGAVVFGSDQGLVGQFNDVVADFAVKKLSALPGTPQIWAIGERVHARLADEGRSLAGLFPVPNSVQAIAPLIGQILVESEARRRPSTTLGTDQGEVFELHLFYNRPASGAVYAPVSQRLLPLDETWRRALAELPWPTKNLPEVMGGDIETLRALIREYLFVSLFRACARIARKRERQPPGGDGTRRQKHRRIAGGPQRKIPSFAPERHRRGIVRCHLRLRSAGEGKTPLSAIRCTT